LTTHKQAEEIVKEILSTGDTSAEKRVSLYSAKEKNKFALSIKYIEEINSALLGDELSKEARQALNHVFYSFYVYGDAPTEQYEYVLSTGCYHPTRNIALNLQLPLGILLNGNMFVLKQNNGKHIASAYQEVIDGAREQSIKDREGELIEYAYKQIRELGLPSVENITPEMALKICNYEIPDHIS
jgi:hypothetical protein